MTERSLKYLSDILMAISLIESFTADITDFEQYERDRKTQSAVERQLSVVGEALNQFRKLEPTVNIKHDKQIVALRNRIIHAYDGIDNSIVWAILKRHISGLKNEIEQLVGH
jgi:uncharacterized protein with HEPN domain